MHQRLRKVIGFGLSVAITGILTLLAIPLTISVGGIDDWAAIAYGQSIGSVGAVFVGYGWGISGPASVASSQLPEHRRLYLDSVKTRLVLLVPFGALIVSVCLIVPTKSVFLCVLGGILAVVMELRPNWYFVGISAPYAMLLNETLPRVLFTTIGLWVMISQQNVFVSVLFQILGLIVALALSSHWILRNSGRSDDGRLFVPTSKIRNLLVEHRHGMSASALSTLFSNAPLIIIGLVSLSSVPIFAVVDRLNKQINTAVSPALDVLRGWIPHGDNTARRARARHALFWTAIFAITSGIFLLFLGPYAIYYLSHRVVMLDATTTAAFSVMFCLSLITLVQGQIVLASLGLMRHLSRNTMIMSLFSLPCIMLFGWLWGTAGALFAISIGQLLLLSLNYHSLRISRAV
ncbi:hypothetical protein [Arthrobacter glacialis]|uniref:hypothetical protein n=1 Tax=Arthrobacter glacialis TaxID=1664 RepID=UPI0010570D23|nr:hypothetical protein [Arthrobacter glacialis]